MYLSRDLALYFHFKKGSDKPSNKFTIPTAAINSSNVFRWFGQHAFTKVFALEIDRSVTYESQFPCRFTFCTVCIHVFFAYFYFVGDILGSFCPFEQCFVYNVHQEITALAMYQPIDIFSSSLYMILNDFIAQQI